MSDEEFPMSENDVYLTQSKSQRDLFEYLASMNVEKGYADDDKAVVDAFLKREAETSTGMFDGIAIPHAISPHIKESRIMVVKNAVPIPWETFDDKDVIVAIAFLIPEQGSQEHLSLLSRVAEKLVDEDNRHTLLNLETSQEIYHWVTGK
ncbi:PTS sugar transporter subunit IIA [Lacticaseibacillus hegangensis]|uniref:PTS sugar transporter subunit IIA n=1 Tax=Lacticaseibacillus hegangensis TaxID=2486010 RepID=A0ABW4CX69_9LACO|nr:PTS sugar transporter subunit IIA [Lacticaseibacillus hegangensis]